tara:strand:- start:232 stop:612 length:381 start_codon:yes stop_codon:yes gene_type:complete
MQITETNKMSIIGDIDGIPLFSTTQGALTWARRNGLSGYHVHQLENQVGYMGGINHQELKTLRLKYISKSLNTNVPPPPVPIDVITNPSSQVTTTPRPSITPPPSPRPSPRSSPASGSSDYSSGGY